MTQPQTAPSDPPACPVLRCPWRPSEDDELEGHLYDAHSARQLAATLTTTAASLETQAAMASGLLNELAGMTDLRDRAIAKQDTLRAELADRRDQVLTEAAELIAAWSTALLEEIDADDLDPSDMERHQQRCEAANVLFAARTTQESRPTAQPAAAISIAFSSGPTIAYIHSEYETATLVDRIAVSSDNLRERALCRALLQTALALLDASEPTVHTARRSPSA